jgi:hypothetical protein
MILCGDEETYPSEFLDEFLDLPPWWGIRLITLSEDNIPPEPKILVPRMMGLVNQVGREVFGHVGSSTNLQQAVRDLAPPDRDSGYRSIDHVGPLGRRHLFTVHRTLGKVSVSECVADTIEGPVPNFYTSLLSFGLAMALQRVYEIYISNRGVLRTKDNRKYHLNQVVSSPDLIFTLDCLFPDSTG